MSRAESSDHPTPDWFFHYWNRIFRFDLDVAAAPHNAKCPRFYTEADNGLERPWFGNVWMNPPYDRTIEDWVLRAVQAVETFEANVVVALLPVRTGVSWWADHIEGKHIVKFHRGRLRFGGNKSHARFDSAVVIFLPPVKPGRTLGDMLR